MTGKNHVRACVAVMAAGAAMAGISGLKSGDMGQAMAAYGNVWGGGLGAFNTMPAIGFGCLGSLLPDVDSKSSTLGRFVHLPLGHRTWTHSLIGLVLVFALCRSLPVWGIMGLFFGYALHVFLDGFSDMGVCWLYPFKKYVYKEGGKWKKGSGGHGAKVAEGHVLKLYRTGKPDPGRKFFVTDARTGRTRPVDGLFVLCVEILCLAACAVRILV